jgi:hypothetical protein
VQLNVDPAAVEKLVADAIVQSALGEKVRKAVADALSKSWDNPIDQAVALTVQQVARDLVRVESEGVIRAAVRAKLTPEYIEQLVDGVLAKFLDKVY